MAGKSPTIPGNEDWGGIASMQHDVGDPCTTMFYPMYCLPMTAAMEMDSIVKHEHLLQTSALVLKTDDHTPLFISQAWLGLKNPDRDNVKWDLLKSILESMFAGTFVVHASWMYETMSGPFTFSGDEAKAMTANGCVWFDFCSVPQEDTTNMMLAVRSIPAYISNSSMFVVLAPPAAHERGMEVDVRTWSGRGWCRTERVVNVLSIAQKPEIVVESSTSRYVIPSKEWLLNPVGKGCFTVDSDKDPLGAVLDGVVSACAKRALAQNNVFQFRFLSVMRYKILDGTSVDTRSDLPYQAWMESLRFASTEGIESGWTPLRFAMLSGRVDIAQHLIEEGADVNLVITQDDAHWGYSFT